MEIISLVAAFEKLMGKGSESSVSKMLQQLLGPYRSVPVSDACRTRPNIKAKEAQQQDHVRGFWIQELYRIRNSSAHPRPCDTRRLAWLLGEHLTMGAFLFPLLVKLLLAEDHRYDLIWEDKAACDAVDMLLAQTDWFTRRDGEGSTYSSEAPTVWAATLAEERRQRYSDDQDDVARRLWQKHLGNQGSEASER